MKALQITLIILCATLVACSTFDFSFGGSKTVGGKGVQFTFLEYPEGDIIEGEQFSLKIRATNYGKESVQGYLCLQDTLADSLGGIQQNECQDFYLPSAEIIDEKVQQEDQVIFFGPYQYRNLQPRFTQTPNIHLSARYSIQSEATMPLCVQKGTLEEKKTLDIDCERQGTVSSLDQPDMPITITQVEKHISTLSPEQSQVSLKITMKQGEEGRVIDEVGPTAAALTENQFVDVRVYMHGVTDFTCSPLVGGKVEMDKSEKVIKCNTIIATTQEYLVQPVTIMLRYNFEKAMSLPGELKLKKEVI